MRCTGDFSSRGRRRGRRLRWHACRKTCWSKSMRLPWTRIAIEAGVFKGGIMLKPSFVMVTLWLALATCFAQSQTGATKKKAATAARPNTSAPTRVTGDPIRTPTGLEYWDIEKGTGEAAINGEKVRVHYTGWLTTGKKYDSS